MESVPILHQLAVPL